MMGWRGKKKKKEARESGYTCARIHPGDSVHSCRSTCRLLKAYLVKSEEDAGGLEGSAADTKMCGSPMLQERSAEELQPYSGAIPGD